MAELENKKLDEGNGYLERRPYAMIMLNNLRVVRFNTKAEMTDAMKGLAQKGIDAIGLRRYPEMENYTQLGIYS